MVQRATRQSRALVFQLPPFDASLHPMTILPHILTPHHPFSPFMTDMWNALMNDHHYVPHSQCWMQILSLLTRQCRSMMTYAIV